MNTRYSPIVISMALMLSALPCVVKAQSASLPTFRDGDKWVYKAVDEKNVSGVMSSSTRKWEVAIGRAGAKSISVTSKPIDSNLPPKEFGRNVDWSISRNIDGKNTVTSKPFDFPLAPGKTWKIEYVENNLDARIKLQKVTKIYSVIGWQDVIVPAGNLRALKIEMEGEWFKEFNEVGPAAISTVAKDQAGTSAVAQTRNASTPKPVTGRLYEAIWYVPETKIHVKAISEDYQAGGVLNHRVTEELESYQLK